MHSEAVEAQPGPSDWFTGRATVRPLASATAPGQAGMGLVSFQPGARSRWHSHPAGQILYVTEGCGWIQEEGSPVRRICNGDAIYTRAGVRHWHGATNTTAMSHLAVTETVGGRNVDWMEPVSPAQYHGPGR